MAFDLLAIGDVSIDQYMRIDEAFVEGTPENDSYRICVDFASKIPVKEFAAFIAGNSCNNVISCTLLGMQCALYTEFGNDSNSELFISELKKLGINTDYCIHNPGHPTNIHTIIVHEGERTIFSYHEKQTYKIRSWEKPKWIYYTSLSEGFENFQAELIDYIKQNGDIGVAFNPGTFHLKAGIESLKNILEVTDVLFVNRVEAEQFVGKDSLENVHKSLHTLGPKLSVITEGANGSSAYDGDTLVKLGVYTDLRPVVDKTGAGDAHSAGVLAALHHGKDLETALKWGNINSSNVIRQVGSIHGQITKDQMEELLGHNPHFEKDRLA